MQAFRKNNHMTMESKSEAESVLVLLLTNKQTKNLIWEADETTGSFNAWFKGWNSHGL